MINEFILPLRIYIEDTDFIGTVYHANYLKFMERARSEWMEQVGYGTDWQKEQKIYFLVHSMSIKFIKPAKLHEQVEVVSTITTIGRASLVYDQYLRPAKGTDKILCRAEVKLACVDDTIRPCAIPEIPFLATIRRTLT